MTTRTDYLTVNGVDVRLVVEQDADGGSYVRVDARNGDLIGEEPGLYYPEPLPQGTPGCAACEYRGTIVRDGEAVDDCPACNGPAR